jgi:hypothetical protein
MQLSNQQLQIAESPLDAGILYAGPAGSGKTTAGVGRLQFLLESGLPAREILLLFPQRTLADPYQQALADPYLTGGTQTQPSTWGGIARRMIDVFWPLLLEKDLFPADISSPTFLTMESTQYFMSHLIHPLIADQGYFESVTMHRNRIYSQLIDNLNKASLMGFSHRDLSDRLKAAWIGEPGQIRIYEDAQYCVNLFRDFCREQALFDFSLQIEVFTQHLWPMRAVQEHLKSNYRHLIFDNLEEDAPVFHDLLEEWLPEFESYLLITDQDAGFRKFLGADPLSASRFKLLADQVLTADDSFVMPRNLELFSRVLYKAAVRSGLSDTSLEKPVDDYFQIIYRPYFPDLLEWAADQCAELIAGGTEPGQIAVLAPYLSESLRFSLLDLLEKRGVSGMTHRPSRSLREEPPTRALLTLAALSHPHFGIIPGVHDAAQAFLQVFGNTDLIRAQHLARAAYRITPDGFQLRPFEELSSNQRERISYLVGEQYSKLREWMRAYRSAPELPLDHFIRRVFGEVLSQPGFGFYEHWEAGRIAEKLVESMVKFRQSTEGLFQGDETLAGREYLRMVREGVIASQYLIDWEQDREDSVYLAPAYTFLMGNQPVDYQIWLDGGSRGWYERIYQPLTHPYVLSRGWSADRPWTDQEEMRVQTDVLQRVTMGLIRRCRKKIFLGITAVDQRGYEQKGLLLRAANRVFLSQEQAFALSREQAR